VGCQLVVRLSLSAAASIGLGAAAAAGEIEGIVAFPTRLVPSLTVYASEIETSRVHTTQLARGQANFTVEVPVGRYVVFLAPNEPGAPHVYGAFTQYTLCTPHDVEGRCEDHALVPVSVTAKAPHAAVTVDDWYLTDAVALQIDRIRSGADGGGPRFASEPLSAPRFSEYPSDSFDGSEAPAVDFGGGELSEDDRQIVLHALMNGPNFAGHVTAVMTRCGPGCGRLVLVDWNTGSIQGLPPSSVPAEIEGALPCHAEAVVFRRDSRLMSISRLRGVGVVTEYYLWNQKTAALVQSTQYQRTSQAFCAVAAR
jgi:hypothetical protein